jgi:nuclear pore complex protein Nup62
VRPDWAVFYKHFPLSYFETTCVIVIVYFGFFNIAELAQIVGLLFSNVKVVYIFVYICVHMCTYVYICVHMCTYVYICVHMCTYAYICVHMRTYVYICIHMFTYAYICVHMCTYAYICVHMRTYVYICVHMFTYAYICVHMCTYVYICVHMCTFVYIVMMPIAIIRTTKRIFYLQELNHKLVQNFRNADKEVLAQLPWCVMAEIVRKVSINLTKSFG